jgi:hypothetical protein
MANEKQEPPRKVYSGKMEPWLEASIKEAEAVAEELWARYMAPKSVSPPQECPPNAPKKRSKGKKKAKDK